MSVFDSQPVKEELSHHWTVYGVDARPEPESVEAVQVNVGVVSVSSEEVVGVPGTVGAVVSTMKAMDPEFAVA